MVLVVVPSMNNNLHYNDDSNKNNDNNNNKIINRWKKYIAFRCFLIISLLIVCHQIMYWGSYDLIIVRRQQKQPVIITKPLPPKINTKRIRDELFMKIANDKAALIFGNSEHILTLHDFPDLVNDIGINMNDYYNTSTSTTSTTTKAVTRESISINDEKYKVWEVLDRAGLQIDTAIYSILPKWSQVHELYGSKPIIIGKESCKIFREHIPLAIRYIGVAGQMNTGTNALYNLLSSNIIIPENNNTNNMINNDNNDNANSSNHSDGGILWTVPWYKHSWLSLRYQYNYLRYPYQHNTVLPIVVIRDPYFWMNSMCQSPYTMIWNKSNTHCPNLIEGTSVNDITKASSSSTTTNNQKSNNFRKKSVYVSERWGSKYIRTWPSLAHLWSSWYREYYEATISSSLSSTTTSTIPDNNNNNDNYNNNKNYYYDQNYELHNNNNKIPRLMIRFEDVLFHSEQVIDEIRQCVGAQWKSPDGTFVYTAAPSKTHPYFAQFKAHQSSLVSALIKYGQQGTDGKRRVENMTQADIAFAHEYLDDELLDVFQYNHPKILTAQT